MNLEIAQAFASAHPLYWGVACFAAGTMGPRLLELAETQGVDWAVRKTLAAQRLFLRARGASPAQIEKLEQHQAAVLQRAADDIKANKDNESEQTGPKT